MNAIQAYTNNISKEEMKVIAYEMRVFKRTSILPGDSQLKKAINDIKAMLNIPLAGTDMQSLTLTFLVDEILVRFSKL